MPDKITFSSFSDNNQQGMKNNNTRITFFCYLGLLSMLIHMIHPYLGSKEECNEVHNFHRKSTNCSDSCWRSNFQAIVVAFARVVSHIPAAISWAFPFYFSVFFYCAENIFLVAWWAYLFNQIIVWIGARILFFLLL